MNERICESYTLSWSLTNTRYCDEVVNPWLYLTFKMRKCHFFFFDDLKKNLSPLENLEDLAKILACSSTWY